MESILEKVNYPVDLKILNFEELVKLSEEIRNMLVETVTETGGHLASSLGVVELTLAIHRIFNSPYDKIIWDVGHQCYSHKLLTGRKGSFSTLRQYKGISGFPDPFESPYDSFIGGHAGTSISAALGMALARDLSRDDYNVIAVIGDGSLGSGVALEAVNHAGHVGTKFIIILNDNGMSISPSVGSLYHLLNMLRFNPKYESAKEEFKRAIVRFPLGKLFWSISKRIKSKFKNIILPSAFWEELGYIYLGPVDGHNIDELEAALKRAHDFESCPVLVHVVTKKGKGYEPAEANAVKYHGISPKKEKKDHIPTYSTIFSKTIIKLMTENNKIVAISAAMLDGTGLAEASRIFPDRVFDVGICEQHAVTLAAGLAAQGYIPIVAIYSTFLQRSYDQILNDVCLQNLHVIFAIDRAGIVGDDGKTHQGVFDISYMRSMPNIIVSAPKDENELQQLLYTAVHAETPMSIRYPRGSGQGVPLQDMQKLQSGKAEILRYGDDLLILAVGSKVYAALTAANQLADSGIDATVVNIRFIKPLDEELILNLVRKIDRIITIEENVIAGGFGSAVLELLNKGDIGTVKVECIGIPNEFIEHGTQKYIRSKYDLDPDGILRRIKGAFPELSIDIFEENVENVSL